MTEQQIGMLHALAMFHLRLGDAPRALCLVAAAFEARPGDPAIFRTVIRCYLDMGEGAAALALIDTMDLAGADAATRTRIAVLRSEALWLVGRHTDARDLRARTLAGLAA